MSETFEISLAQAHAYEQHFVPALFEQWVPALLDHAQVQQGHRVLDVACGTGVVARGAAVRAGDPSLVTGIDLNPAMIEVAGEAQPDIDWRVGDALDLPFGTAEFDTVVCQSALMFFGDRARALAEVARVLAPGGRVALQTYSAVAEQPGYGPFVETVVRHAGERARELLGLYWSAGDRDELTAHMLAAGLEVTGIDTVLGIARFDSVESMAATEIRGTPLSEGIPPDMYDEIVAECQAVLREYVTPAGALEMPIRAVFVAARKSPERDG